MPKQPWEHLLPLIGFVTWGDVGGLTMHTCKKGRIITFLKTYPEGPPTQDQLDHRAKFKAAVDAWNDLTPAARASWELATRRLSLAMHGVNRWIHWQLTADDSAIETIERQTGLELLPPPPPPPPWCQLDPDEFEVPRGQPYDILPHACKAALPQGEAVSIFYECTGGYVYAHRSVPNCAQAATDIYYAPPIGGDYTITCFFTWSDADACQATAIAHVTR